MTDQTGLIPSAPMWAASPPRARRADNIVRDCGWLHRDWEFRAIGKPDLSNTH